MKGVVLAGGGGTRLYPLTRITNKHLLPIYDKPMIYYPIQTLVDAGITDIMIVTGGNNAGDFLRLLGNGREFGLKDISYTYQERAGGIAEALGLAEHFVGNDRCCVILGDQVFEDPIAPFVAGFKKQKAGSKILLKEVPDADRFGVAELSADRKTVIAIEEKPRKPKTNLAVTGIYFYDAEVFHIIKTLRPSARGELEVTDINNHYIDGGAMTWDLLKGPWTDAGTFESLLRANTLMKDIDITKETGR